MNREDWLGGRQDNKGWGSSQKGEAKGHRDFRLYCHSSGGQPPGSRVFEEKVCMGHPMQEGHGSLRLWEGLLPSVELMSSRKVLLPSYYEAGD